MPRVEILDRFRGRRKAKVLVDKDWQPSNDFHTLSRAVFNELSQHQLISPDGSPCVSFQTYLEWWKRRTYGRSLEFSSFPITLTSREQDAALCLLFDAASISYELVDIPPDKAADHNLTKGDCRKIPILRQEAFDRLLLWNAKIDPYETLKCLNETVQSSSFQPYTDKKVSFVSMPRSHLPETADIASQALMLQWRTSLVKTLQKERLKLLGASKKARPPPTNTTSSRPSDRVTAKPASESSHPTSSASGSASTSETRKRLSKPPPTTTNSSTRPRAAVHKSSSSTTHKPSPSVSENAMVLSQPAPVEDDEAVTSSHHQLADSTSSLPLAPASAADDPPPADTTWRNVAWTIGSKVLYEALAALGREHSLRTEERQINMRLAAAAAEQNQQFWQNVASWGAWSAHTALQFYFGGGNRGANLLTNGRAG